MTLKGHVVRIITAFQIMDRWFLQPLGLLRRAGAFAFSLSFTILAASGALYLYRLYPTLIQ